MQRYSSPYKSPILFSKNRFPLLASFKIRPLDRIVDREAFVVIPTQTIGFYNLKAVQYAVAMTSLSYLPKR